MAENRVTTNVIEVGIVRNSVPGNARVTADAIEVALIRVAPGGNARATAQCIEVAVLRATGVDAARHGDFYFAR